MSRKIKLSVLDQSPVRKGATARQALLESAELVKLADRLGYTRYWVSEHHNTTSLAGSTPEVLIAHLAGETKNIRLGSGGIMLPNHSALKVAENFRMLEALFPGRIDLGIGRAPGGDRLTASILNPSNNFDPQEFVQQMVELQAYLSNDTPTDALHEKVKAIPLVDTAPEMWILTSSGESGLLAAHFGMALSFAQFINPYGGTEAVNMYRERFRSSEALKEPMVNVGLFAFCADTEERANELQAVMDFRLISLEKGMRDMQPDYAEIKNYRYTENELQRIQYNRPRMITGTPDKVKEDITVLADAYDVDEIVIATITQHFEDRTRSYELLAEAFNLNA